jgi:hypothetical protein
MNERDDLDDDVLTLDRCAAPGCRRLSRGIFCAKHQRDLARLDTDRDPDPPPEAA